jgi:hypothetical protein
LIARRSAPMASEVLRPCFSRTVFTSKGSGSGKVLGVAAALKAKSDPSFEVRPQIFDEFSLPDGVAVVSSATRAGLPSQQSVACSYFPSLDYRGQRRTWSRNVDCSS